MRSVLVATALLTALPALAQSVQEDATRVLIDSFAEADFSEATQAAMVTCYTDRMTEAEAAVLVDAEGDADALLAAGQMMIQNHPDLALCIAAALE